LALFFVKQIDLSFVYSNRTLKSLLADLLTLLESSDSQLSTTLKDQLRPYITGQKRSSAMSKELFSAIRTELNKTQEDFAYLLNMTPRHLRRLESGQRRITEWIAERAISIAVKNGINIEMRKAS
jgi:DNA-binding transcriptional regulator YiaG